MKAIFLTLLVIGCLAFPAFSMWGPLDLDIAVQDSDLIIVGTLNGVSEYSQDGKDYGQGTILIEKVIWGNVRPGETLTLKWENASNILCPRIEHSHNQGKQGIWLLTTKNGHEVEANHPQRFVDPKEKKKVERFLLKKKIALRAYAYTFSKDEPINVSIVFRNATQTQLQSPGLQFRDGYLYISPGVELIIKTGYENGNEQEVEKVTPLPNRIVMSDSIAPITVEAGQEYRETLNLRELFSFKPERSYFCQLKVKGHEPVNVLSIYENIPDAEKKAGDSNTIISSAKNEANTGSILSPIGWIVGLSMFSILYRLKK